MRTGDGACAPKEWCGALRACNGRVAFDGAVNSEVGSVACLDGNAFTIGDGRRPSGICAELRTCV